MQAQCGPGGRGGTGWGVVLPSCLWCTWHCLLRSRPLQPRCVMCSNPLSVCCCRSYADFESHQWRECLASPSLPYVLQILTGLCQNHHTTQVSSPLAKVESTVALCLLPPSPSRIPPHHFLPFLHCIPFTSPTLLPPHSASWLMSPHNCMCWSRSHQLSTLGQ